MGCLLWLSVHSCVRGFVGSYISMTMPSNQPKHVCTSELTDSLQQSLHPGNFVVVDLVPHAGVQAHRHIAPETLQHLRTLDHALFRYVEIDIAAPEENRGAIERAWI